MREISIESSKAILISLLLAFTLVPISFWIFYELWGNSINFVGELLIIKSNLIWSLLAVLLGVVFHELLHAFAYLVLTKGDYNNISFGLIWNSLSPYCHYSAAILVWKYRVSVLLPGMVIGLIPLVIACFIGSFPLYVFGILFTLGAAGDFTILWKIRKLKSKALIQDHPDKVGCIVIEEK